MSREAEGGLVTLGTTLEGVKALSADKEAHAFQQLHLPTCSLSETNYDQNGTFLLLPMRGNTPMAVHSLTKGIFGKGHVKCRSLGDVCNHQLLAWYTRYLPSLCHAQYTIFATFPLRKAEAVLL